MKLKINPVFKNLIPPLSPDEYAVLENLLLTEGCRHAINVWNGTIVDGHNRYEICNKHSLDFKTEEVEFASEDEAKIWIIKTQFGRRSINHATRAMLALELEPLIAEQAKRNQATSSGGIKPQLLVNSPKAENKINTRKEVANLAKVSESTIKEVKKVKESGNKEVIDKMLSGQISVHKAYSETYHAPTRHCKTCGLERLSSEFNGRESECKACSYERGKKLRLFEKVDAESILESMTKKEPSEDGKGKNLDNSIISEFASVVDTFLSDINKYLYMPYAFSELTKSDEPIKDLIKAKHNIETILKMIKE